MSVRAFGLRFSYNNRTIHGEAFNQCGGGGPQQAVFYPLAAHRQRVNLQRDIKHGHSPFGPLRW